eukprot:165407-Prymnesium_polylepis.1
MLSEHAVERVALLEARGGRLEFVAQDGERARREDAAEVVAHVDRVLDGQQVVRVCGGRPIIAEAGGGAVWG